MNGKGNVALLSNFFSLSGTQQLASSIANVFKENGYKLSVITGKKSKFIPDNVDNVNFLRYPYYQDANRALILLNELILKWEIGKQDLEMYKLTFNNQPNTFLYNASMNYLHGPSFFESFMNQQGEVVNHFLYRVIRALGIYKIYRDGLFLTHGNYSKEYAKRGFKLLNLRPRSIIPIDTPVQYPILDKLPIKDSNLILTFGRISPDKNLEMISNVARLIPSQFIIAGYLSKERTEYASKLRKIMPANVKIIENPSDTDKIDLYKRANIYLHTKPREHFGLTVAEALWFGCIPVVPKSGGAWEDIISKGKYGYGYDNEDELVGVLNDLRTSCIDDEMFNSRFRFSAETFSEKFTKIISNIN
ncbi:MAG: glycosyltransferase family 4 protein [Thermoplasmataceae archaeon]|jgi:glycosyltransferase involved in cell wall biosynthesis